MCVQEAPAAVVWPSEVPNVPRTASIDSTVGIPPVPKPPPPLFFSLSVSFRSPLLPPSPSVSRFVFTQHCGWCRAGISGVPLGPLVRNLSTF